mgnify:CR=1 FL=1
MYKIGFGEMASLSFLIVVAFAGCHNPKQLPEEKPGELPVFDLEAVAEETGPNALMWNDITEKATFIPLSFVRRLCFRVLWG